MERLLLCASVVLVCYFASDVVQVPTYPATTAATTAVIRTATAKVMAAMANFAALLIAVCAIAFGCSFMRVGKYALLSQDLFFLFCSRGQRMEEFETDAFDAITSGEPVNLRLLGVGLLAIGLLIVISVASLLLIRIGNLT